MRLNQGAERCPGNQYFHLRKESFTSRCLVVDVKAKAGVT
jgi:hypothetical protein